MSVIFVLYEAIAHMYDIVSFLDNQKALHFTQWEDDGDWESKV